MTGSTELPDRLLISGIPGAGKSWFVDWLSNAETFRALKVDDAPPPTSEIVRAASVGDAAFVRTIVDRMGPRVVIEFGYGPDNSLRAVRTLMTAGFEAWWFSAAYPDAFAKYCQGKRGTLKEAFYSQVGKISTYWPEIEPLYPGRIIETLHGSTHVPPEKIAEAIRIGPRHH
jgi:hypothetical protein